MLVEDSNNKINIKLWDIGLASILLKNNVIFSTYSSPQILFNRTLDAYRSNIWSVGCLFSKIFFILILFNSFIYYLSFLHNPKILYMLFLYKS